MGETLKCSRMEGRGKFHMDFSCFCELLCNHLSNDVAPLQKCKYQASPINMISILHGKLHMVIWLTMLSPTCHLVSPSY